MKQLRIKTNKTLDISQFVNPEEIPPHLFEKPYFIVPDPRVSVEAFSVVREAMVRAHKSAIGEIAFGGREHLIAVAPAPGKKERGMMGYTLRYAEELRNAKDYFSDIAEPTIGKKELNLASELIKSHSASFHLDEFKDDYEVALLELIEAKRTETPLPTVEEKPRRRVANLMDALRRSVDESRGKPSEPERRAKKGPTLVKSGKRSHRAA